MPFRDITGHRSLVGLLARAVARDSLPPSLIFAGPDGVGKRVVALALAQALNCPTPVRAKDGSGEKTGVARGESRADLEIDACGSCDVCRRIARGIHADILRVAPGDSGSIKIEQAREVIERSAYRPFEGRRRVVIVDEADALVPEAQNALLKTLEEPPPSSVFLLVTARPDVLLSTVRSRCPRLRFGRLSAREIADVLMRVHGYAEPDARASAAAADGSLGRALAEGAGALVDARVDAGRVLHETARGDARRRLESAQELVGKGQGRAELEVRLHALASLVRDLSILASRADVSTLANADLKQDLETLLPAFDPGRAVRAFSAIDRALGALERNASPKVIADWLVFQL